MPYTSREFGPSSGENAKKRSPPAVPGWARIVAQAPGIILTIYWWLTYSGPFRWVATWEAQGDGRYSPKFTAICVQLPFILGAELLLWILVRIGWVGRQYDPFVDGFPGARSRRSTWQAASNEPAMPSKFAYVFHPSGGYRAAIGICVLLLIGAAVMHVRDLRSRRSPLMTALEFEYGARPSPDDWIEVAGIPLVDVTVAGDKASGYVPLVSPTWHVPEPVSIFVWHLTQASTAPLDARRLHSYAGRCTSSGLPPEVASAFTRLGISPSLGAAVLQVGPGISPNPTIAWRLLLAAPISLVLISLITAGRRWFEVT